MICKCACFTARLYLRRERAAIISALHAVKSTSSLWPHGRLLYTGHQQQRPVPSSGNGGLSSPWLKIFNRSHRVRDIVAICTDERYGLHASNEYRDRESLQDAGTAVGTAGHGLMEEYANDRSANGWWPRGLGRDSTCWSCAAVYGGSFTAEDEDYAESVEEEEEEMMDVQETVVDDGETTTPPQTWMKRKFSRLLLQFKRKTDH